MNHYIRPFIALILLTPACGEQHEPEEPRLELREGPTLIESSEIYYDVAPNCEPEFSRSPDEVFHVLHVLHPKIGDSGAEIGKLAVSVRTACVEETYSFTHDDNGVVSAPIKAPMGAECGIIVKTEIANVSSTCALGSVEAAVVDGVCTVECPAADPSMPPEDGDDGADTGDTETG